MRNPAQNVCMTAKALVCFINILFIRYNRLMLTSTSRKRLVEKVVNRPYIKIIFQFC